MMLSGIKVKAEYMSNDTIEVSSTLIAQNNLYYKEAYDALVVLSTRADYKCIEVVHYTDMHHGEEFPREEVVALVTLLPNFHDTLQKFHRYFVFLRSPVNAVEQHPDEDWSLLEERFEFNNPDIDWTPKKQEDTPGFALNNPDIISPSKTLQATIKMIGNDVIMYLPNGEEVIIKRLRTDNAPYHFMRYMTEHPDTFITKTIIQTDVQMCTQKRDMTELARQCGFKKNLKPYFFAGSTKDKVRFSPHANVSDEIVTQLLA